MKVVLVCLIAMFFVATASAEPAWHTNGFTLSNVNTLQRGHEVTVSGRVSSGPMKSPLQVFLYLADDEGTVYRAIATVPHYTGRGELFETKFNAWKRAKWWKVVDVKTN